MSTEVVPVLSILVILVLQRCCRCCKFNVAGVEVVSVVGIGASTGALVIVSTGVFVVVRVIDRGTVIVNDGDCVVTAIRIGL